MKLATLKKTLNTLTGRFVMFALLFFVTQSHAGHMQNPEAEVEKLLTTCLFDKNNSKPFYFFIDKIIDAIESNKPYFLAKVANDEQYLNNFINVLKNIRNARDVNAIAKALQQYKAFMPANIIKRGLFSIAAGLKYRLTCKEKEQIAPITSAAVETALDTQQEVAQVASEELQTWQEKAENIKLYISLLLDYIKDQLSAAKERLIPTSAVS